MEQSFTSMLSHPIQGQQPIYKPQLPPFEIPVVSNERREALLVCQHIDNLITNNNKTHLDYYSILDKLSSPQQSQSKQPNNTNPNLTTLTSGDVINAVHGVIKKCEISEGLLGYLNHPVQHLLHSCREQVSYTYTHSRTL